MKTPTCRSLFLLLTLIGHPWVHAGVGSLWSDKERASPSLYADRVANQVGDLLTIVIKLETEATKNQKTESNKKNSVNDVLTTFLYPESDGPFDFYRYRDPNNPQKSFPPTFTWSADQKTSGGGKINNTETLTTTIQARVIEINPNGTMLLEARRRYESGEEKSDLVLTGFVRREDISVNNSVDSTKIADLQIVQEGTGTLSRQQRKGWLTKFYELLNPF